MRQHFLYRHIRLDKNEPFYIGIGTVQERDLNNKRQRIYYRRAYEEAGRNNIWHKIVLKTNYEVEILLESDDYEFIKQKEIEFITLYGRIDLGLGTLSNLTDGGQGVLGVIKTGEAKQKYRNSVLGTKRPQISGENNPFYGKTHSKEAIVKMSGENNHNFGKDPWNKGLENLNMRGELHPMSRKVINIITLEIFNTVNEAASSIKIPRSDLSRYMIKDNGRQNPTPFIYIDDYIEGMVYTEPTTFNKPKKVINNLTGEIFESMKKASDSINMDSEKFRRHVTGQCKNKTDFVLYENKWKCLSNYFNLG